MRGSPCPALPAPASGTGQPPGGEKAELGFGGDTVQGREQSWGPRGAGGHGGCSSGVPLMVLLVGDSPPGDPCLAGCPHGGGRGGGRRRL